MEMTIDLIILIQMIIAAFAGTVLYTVIGIIPGTDETSVLVPVTAVLVILGLAPLVILVFFIASIVTLNLTDSIPTALTAIPGGVMATPLVESSQYLKEKGLTTSSIKKMTMGSLIGTLVAIPMALLVYLIVHLIQKWTGLDLKQTINKYNNEIFFSGAIILSLLSKKKIVSLISIIPFSILILLARGDLINTGVSISGTPFFLSITTGPLLASLVMLLLPKERKKETVIGNQEVIIEREKNENINVFQILTGRELRVSIISSVLASITFFLSPVGMTLLIGETVTNNIEDEEEKALTKVASMNAISNSSYLAGIMISLLVFKIPISPAAIGPGAIILDKANDFINISFSNAMIAIIIGVIIALSITVYLTLRYASKMTEIVFKYISQESVLILLISLVFLLVFLDAGFLGVLIILVVGVISGFLNKAGVTYGVQFMAFYAAPLVLKYIEMIF